MSSKVDFSNEMFSVLSEGGKQEHSSLECIDYQLPLWDILKEIDRRGRRAERDKSGSIREYISAHPEEVERIRKKHGV